MFQSVFLKASVDYLIYYRCSKPEAQVCHVPSMCVSQVIIVRVGHKLCHVSHNYIETSHQLIRINVFLFLLFFKNNIVLD